MIRYPQSQLQWEIVHIAAYLTQKKLTQQIIAYPSEKQDKIPKNKPKQKKLSENNDSSIPCQMKLCLHYGTSFYLAIEIISIF